MTILLLPLKLVVFNNNYYISHFERNNIYEQVPEANEIMNNTIAFFQGEAELEYFSEDEQNHMEDVKILLSKFMKLVDILWLIFLVCLVVLFFLNKERFLDDLFKQIFLAGLAAFILIALIFLASLNFSMMFGGFHKLFFSQGNYMFSENSLLIQLFPEYFFKATLLKILIVSVLVSFGVMIPQFILHKIKS